MLILLRLLLVEDTTSGFNLKEVLERTDFVQSNSGKLSFSAQRGAYQPREKTVFIGDHFGLK